MSTLLISSVAPLATTVPVPAVPKARALAATSVPVVTVVVPL